MDADLMIITNDEQYHFHLWKCSNKELITSYKQILSFLAKMMSFYFILSPYFKEGAHSPSSCSLIQEDTQADWVS